MSDKNFPPSSGDSSKPVLVANVSTGPEGPAAVYAYPAGPVVPIPCDNDGTNPVYTSATSDILVYQGGILLTGWTLAYTTGSGCTGTVNNAVEPRTATIANVTADSGYADFTATKDGVVLAFRLYFSKMPEGEQGIQGIQGIQGDKGDTGLTGAAGTHGTGLAVLKFTVTVEDEFPGVITGSDNGGNLRLTFGTDPVLALGEVIYIHSLSPTWYAYMVITAVVGGGVYDTDEIYQAPGTLYVWSARNFRKGGPLPLAGVNAVAAQDIMLPHIIPEGSRLDEIAIVRIAEGTKIMFWSAGYQVYPDAGYDRYLSSQFISSIGNRKSVNLWDPTRYGYIDRILYGEDVGASISYRSFYFRGQKYLTDPSNYWNTTPVEDMVHEIFISYKYFPTSLSMII